MDDRRQTWTNLLLQEGSTFLEWLETNGILSQKLDTLAKALHWLLEMEVRTNEEAIAVCKAVPAAYKDLKNQSVYEDLWTAVAYAGLHLLDRYVRTWVALERLVTANCLPLAKYGVNVLDVGTGPGPSAFAIHDFYSAVTQFSEHSGNRKWRQPVLVYCVEKARATNHLRHLLGEMVYELSQRQSMNVLVMTRHMPDFSQILPNQQRKALQKALNSTEDEYSYDTNSEWSSELWFWAHVSNFKAQSLHRYRLLVFSNFLTDVDELAHFEPNLFEIFRDSSPGTALMLLGGKGGDYPQIYDTVGQLARSTGFELKIDGVTVSWENSAMEARIREEGERFYRYLRNLAPNEDHLTREICSYFQGHPPSSQLWAYRKYSWQ